MKTIFINPERCIACHQCEFACSVEQSQSKDICNSASESPAPRRFIIAAKGVQYSSSFPKKCYHCGMAPCITICGSAAISRDADMNTVLIDVNKCVLCGMCALVCPFGIITYSPSVKATHQKPVATKCDNCIDRQHQGWVPACVEACKTGALQFGDLDELAGRIRTKTGQSISVAPIEGNHGQALLKDWRDWDDRVRIINER